MTTAFHLKSESSISKKIAEHNRKSASLGLPGTLHYLDWIRIVEHFGSRCALTCSFDISIEHFLPQSIGHGGTTIKNVYPLDTFLNSSKGDSNPFVWAEQNRDTVEPAVFGELVTYLANQNGLTVDDYRDYVFWCFQNPRTRADIARDGNVSSVDLWKAARYREQRNRRVMEILSKPFGIDQELYEEFVIYCFENSVPMTSESLRAYFAAQKAKFLA